jgi:plasmid maintenance system antidote protein VapI
MTVVRPRRTALEMAEQELAFKLKRMAATEAKLHLILQSVVDLKESHAKMIARKEQLRAEVGRKNKQTN